MKKNSLIGVLTILILASNSCIKEKYTNYEATLINTTNHKITILPYKNGIVESQDTIKLDAFGSFRIAKGSQRGENIKVPGFWSRYFGGPNDSNVVVFNDSFRVVHYANTPTTSLAEKHYLNTSKRNIANPESYEFEREKDKQDVFLNIHNYYFTEEDYIYASE